MITTTTQITWWTSKWLLGWVFNWKSREDLMEDEILRLRKEVDFLKANMEWVEEPEEQRSDGRFETSSP